MKWCDVRKRIEHFKQLRKAEEEKVKDFNEKIKKYEAQHIRQVKFEIKELTLALNACDELAIKYNKFCKLYKFLFRKKMAKLSHNVKYITKEIELYKSDLEHHQKIYDEVKNKGK